MAKRKEPDNLALEAMAAKRAGMSYGVWKSLQKPKTTEKGIPEGYLVCQHCGDVFMQTTKRKHKYCGAVCCNEAGKARTKARLQGVYL